MRADSRNNRESGIVLLLVLVLIVLGLIVGAWLFVKQRQDQKPISTTAADAVTTGSATVTRNAENLKRRNDANQIIAAAQKYVTENNGQVPTRITATLLEGLGHYKTASIVTGEQGLIAGDELRLVTGAKCGINGATVVSVRGFAAQFALQNRDGSFGAQCVEQ